MAERERSGTLEQMLTGGPLPADQAVRIATDVLAALAQRHARGQVHGRVSAAHVLLAGGTVVLAEPDAAPVRPQDQAPELLDGGSPTVQSDVFAVGILLYRALTGEFPFSGQNLTEIVDAHLAGPRPLRDRVRVPEPLAAVVDAALERRVAGRPQSASELAARLRVLDQPATVEIEPAETPARPGKLPGPDQTLFGRFLVMSVMSRRVYDGMYLVKDARAAGRLLTLRVGLPDAPLAQVQLEHDVAVLRSIRNPFVVRVLESGFDEGLPWTLYQPLRGSSLRARLLGGALGVEEAVGVMVQLLEALRATHAAGWVHRDVKPENLLEEVPETYRLAGYDLAMRPDPHGEEHHAPAGTPAYMAPEQIAGGPIGPHTDLFAAGVVLYELLSGEPPFPSKDLRETLDCILHRPAPPLPPSSQWPFHLEGALHRAMAKRPEDRFADAVTMRLAMLGVEGP